MTHYGDTDDVEATLRLIARRKELLNNEERNLRELVAKTREAGASWASIGHALGTSRQGALKRFGTPPDAVALEGQALRKEWLESDPILSFHAYIDGLSHEELVFRARYPATAAYEDEKAGRGVSGAGGPVAG